MQPVTALTALAGLAPPEAPALSETLVRNIRRATRKHHAAEEKIRIVLDGLRGETSIADTKIEKAR